MPIANDVTGDDRHRHRGGMPTARRQAPEVGLGGLFVKQMEGLGIVLAGELQHFLASHFIRAEARLRTDDQVFEIDHRRRIASTGAWRERRRRARLEAWPRKRPYRADTTRA